jgi:WD40 repeat protein
MFNLETPHRKFGESPATQWIRRQLETKKVPMVPLPEPHRIIKHIDETYETRFMREYTSLDIPYKISAPGNYWSEVPYVPPPPPPIPPPPPPPGPGTYQYSRILDSVSNDEIRSVTCDSSGNVYFAGYYEGTPTIKDEADVPLGTLPTAEIVAAFVSKFDSSGVYQYSRIIDGLGGFGSNQVNSVTFDSSGNMYIAGSYSGTPTIYEVTSGGVSTLVGTLPTAEFIAGFVCKFNSSGVYQYSRIIDGSGNDQVNSVTCDSSGNMYIAGFYQQGTPTIKDEDDVPLGTLPTPVGRTGFVSKFNSSGVYQYSRIIDGTGNDQVRGVACDSSGNMYIVGSYTEGTPTIKDEADVPLGTLPESIGGAGFVCKFNSSGVYQYSRIIDGDISFIFDEITSVTCDSSENVYIAGFYSGGATIKDEAEFPLGTLPFVEGRGGFVSKFNSSGVYQYSRIIFFDFNDEITNVTCDSSGNVYFSGYYTGTPTIKDEAEVPLGTLPTSIGGSGFVCKFNSSGVYQYSRVIDSAGFNQVRGVACDSSGNMYIAGSYTETPTIKDQGNTPLGTLPVATGGAGFVSSFLA